ncbi:MAG: hypothetical protein EU551_04685, partial [Promethearchaeota archaeon]
SMFGLSIEGKKGVPEEWILYLKELIPKEYVKYIIHLEIYPFTMSAKKFARKINKTPEEAEEILNKLFNNDAVMRVHSKSKSRKYEYAIHLPFLLFDAPVLNFNHGYTDEKAKRVAELSLKFLEDGWYKNFEGSKETPLSRIVPVQESIQAKSQILPYEDVEIIIDNAKVLCLFECACRARLQMVGKRKCVDKFPLETCIGVNQGGQYVIDRGKGREIGKDEAKKLLKKFNKMGLVQTTENFQEGDHMILCSCCPCCCNLLGGITKPFWENPRAIASSNYIAKVDAIDNCTRCETCTEKCPFSAINLTEKGPEINQNRCMGCGICVVNCPSNVFKLERLEREHIYKNQIELGIKVINDKIKN